MPLTTSASLCSWIDELASILRARLLLLFLALFLSAPSSAAAAVDGSVWLLWTAPGDDGADGRSSRYEMRFSTASVGTDTTSWWNLATPVTGLPSPSPSGATDSVLVTNLGSGTRYFFIVQAWDDVGLRSPFSNVAQWTSPSDTIPLPPGCVVPAAMPADFAASADTGVVALSWSATSDTIAHFVHVYRGVGTGGSLSLLTTAPSSTTEYRDTGVNPGGIYRYRIAWASSCGDGPRSATLSVEVPGRTAPSPGGAGQPTLHAYPNPSSGPVQFVITVVGSEPQPARIRLFDLTGRWIADLADEILIPGQHTISWSRVGRSGERVAPGYYEAIGSVGGASVRERIVLLP